MAIELEQKIMQEIGLGMHYNWYNGSSSCHGIAQNAIKKLPAALKRHKLTVNNK